MSNSSQAVNIYNANAISRQSKIRKNLILKKRKKTAYAQAAEDFQNREGRITYKISFEPLVGGFM